MKKSQRHQNGHLIIAEVPLSLADMMPNRLLALAILSLTALWSGYDILRSVLSAARNSLTRPSERFMD